jgi:hypothetical protein
MDALSALARSLVSAPGSTAQNELYFALFGKDQGATRELDAAVRSAG